MIHSIPSRSLSPFRRNDTDKKKKRTSLRINTTGNNNEQELAAAVTVVTSPTSSTSSRVRQRLSSLFKSSTKEPIQITSQSTPLIKTLSLSEEDTTTTTTSSSPPFNESTDSLSSSSDSSDHMPASPADHTSFWHTTTAPSPPPHQVASLAFQVHQILGSVITEVDEEIDMDWECSRDKLRQSITQYPTTQTIHF